MRWIELVRCIFDSMMVVWFFRRMHDPLMQTPKKLLCFLILLTAAPIYPTSAGGIDLTLIRFVYRSAVIAAWLAVRKKTGLKESIYYALLCWIAFTTENNIFLTPQLSFLRWNRINFSEILLVNQFISLFIELVAEFLILTLISRAFPWEDRHPNWRVRFGAAAIVVVCQLYVKASLKAISGAIPEHYVLELTLYPILMQLALTAALVLLERHFFQRRRLEEARLDEVAARYRYETAQAKAQADMDIRRLHHDMKNHLLGIQKLASDNDKLEKYVADLISSTEDYEMICDSGNSMIDGLLSEKQRVAAAKGISFSAAVDLRNAGFINDMDLCIIFGNALDNAIEASSRVKDADLRSIMVRCRREGSNLVLSVQNYYEGELKKEGSAILTSKTEPGHGLGLSSIRRAVGKYGGIMTTATDDYHNFILTVMIPPLK